MMLPRRDINGQVAVLGLLSFLKWVVVLRNESSLSCMLRMVQSYEKGLNLRQAVRECGPSYVRKGEGESWATSDFVRDFKYFFIILFIRTKWAKQSQSAIYKWLSRLIVFCLGIQEAPSYFITCWIIINRMKDQSLKKRQTESDQVKAKLRKKPMTEDFGDTQVYYGLLDKKNQKFVFSNQRLLVLKSNKSIGYARNIPEKTLVPFLQESNFPKLKREFDLTKIQNVFAPDQNLTIQFLPETKEPKWEFVCDSKPIATDWRTLILNAVNAHKLNNSNKPIQVTLPDQNNSPQQAQNGQQPNNFPQQGPYLQGSPQYQQGMQPQQPWNNMSPINPNNQSSAYSQNSPQQHYYSSINSSAKKGLEPIPEQNPDNETEHGNNRHSSHPLGLEDPQRQPDILNLSIKNNTNNNFANSINNMNAQGPPADLREEYLRKKKEEEFIKNSMGGEEVPLGGSGISANKPRNEKKILDCNWDYQFLKGESQYVIIERFKSYVEDIVRVVIDQLALEERRRHYKPTVQGLGQLKYEVGGVCMQVGLLQLNEVSTFQQRSTIVGSDRVKQLRQQFKNGNYILQITRNRGRFRVPLMMLVEYKGFTVLAQASVHSSNDYSALSAALQQDIAQLQRDTKISRSLFEDEQNIKVVAADQKFYQKLSRSENKYRKYDVCFLTNINHYLPQDFHGFTRTNTNKNRLRAEMLQDEEYDDLLLNGGDLNAVLSRVKVPTETRDAINLLTDIAKSIPERVSTLVLQVQSLDRPLSNSQELSSLLHDSGLNMRYLGLLLDNAKEQWVKSLLLAEIVARSAKCFLRYDLQDSALNLAATTSQAARDYQLGQVLGWLNRLFGIGPESDGLWRQIFRQAQTTFKCTVSRDNLNVGFLVQALQHHGRFRLQGLTLNEPFFRANNIFQRGHFVGFELNSRTYDLDFTEHYQSLNGRLRDLSFQSYQQVRSILNLQKRDSLQAHYGLNGTDRRIVLYLTHWLSPSEAPHLYRFNQAAPPTLHNYEVQLTAVKWQLKAGRVVQAERLKDAVVEHVNRWLGECHPVLAELFDIFARYYLRFRQEEKRAVSYSKNALKNQQKLLGANHIKLADAYYALGDIHLHYAKKADALQALKRAAQILTQNQATSSEPFVEISIKVGQLCLANHAGGQAIASARQALTLSEELKNLQQYLSAAELMGRCLEITEKWPQYLKFANELSVTLPLYRESQGELQRVMKVVFMPILHNIATRSRDSCRALSGILAEFSQRNNAQAQGYAFIRSKIEERIFPAVFFDYIDSLQMLLREINSTNVLTRWRGFENSGGRNGRAVQFLGMLQALNCFLSGNFVGGIFAEQQ